MQDEALAPPASSLPVLQVRVGESRHPLLCSSPLDPSRLMILSEEQCSSAPARLAGEQDAPTAPSPVGPPKQQLHWLVSGRGTTQNYVNSTNYLKADRITSPFPVVYTTDEETCQPGLVTPSRYLPRATQATSCDVYMQEP